MSNKENKQFIRENYERKYVHTFPDGRTDIVLIFRGPDRLFVGHGVARYNSDDREISEWAWHKRHEMINQGRCLAAAAYARIARKYSYNYERGIEIAEGRAVADILRQGGGV